MHLYAFIRHYELNNLMNKITDYFKTVKDIQREKNELNDLMNDMIKQIEQEKIISARELERQIEEEMRRDDRHEREHGGSWWRM